MKIAIEVSLLVLIWTGSLIASCSDFLRFGRAEEDLGIGNGRLSRRRTYVGTKSGVDQTQR